MNPYVIEVSCSVCGGAGLARPGDEAAEWLGGELAHIDPRTCRDELVARRRALSRGPIEDAAEPPKEASKELK